MNKQKNKKTVLHPLYLIAQDKLRKLRGYFNETVVLYPECYAINPRYRL